MLKDPMTDVEERLTVCLFLNFTPVIYWTRLPITFVNRNMTNDQDETDEILGVVRCARCGHRLEGEIECPFCSLFQESTRSNALPKWIYITACFLTSPLSVYFIFKNKRLSSIEKVLTLSGCLFWFALYFAL
jgi:hypothetical protein